MTPAQGARSTAVAIVMIAGKQMPGRFQNPMKTACRSRPFIAQLTGIPYATVATTPAVQDAVRKAARTVGDAPMVVHNASFDRWFWQAGLALVGRSAPPWPAARLPHPGQRRNGRRAADATARRSVPTLWPKGETYMSTAIDRRRRTAP